MSAGTSEFFCLICFLVCSCSAQTNITAEVGQEVILPCKVPKKNNNINNITAVEWIRPDLDPDHVLIYRDGRFDPDNQHPSYQNRVDLQDKEMKDGDVSLVLKDVTMEDTGRYNCRVYQRIEFELISIVNLRVLPSGDKDGINILYIVGGIAFLLAVAAAVGFRLYKRHKRQNQHRPVPSDQPPPVEMPPVPEVPPEQPTASVPLMERPAEEQTEM